MDYRITHRTTYEYQRSISLCHNRACLVPRSGPYQQCLSSRVEIRPDPEICRQRLDYFGNTTTHFCIQHLHRRLEVTAVSEVRTHEALHGPDPAAWDAVYARLCARRSADDLEALSMTLASPCVSPDPVMADYAAPSFTPGRPFIEAVQELTQRIFSDFTYDVAFTTVATPVAEVMTHRRGVCQDFAHIAIACLRALGLPARYVSGYLETLPPPGQPKLVGADASHAWFAVYSPESGWLDFDPTNNQPMDSRYITLAWGRDFSDVAPIKGVFYGSGGQSLTVAVDVTAMT